MPKKIRIKPILDEGYTVRELTEILGNFRQFDKISNIERLLYRLIRDKKVETVPDSRPVQIRDKSFSDLVKGRIVW